MNGTLPGQTIRTAKRLTPFQSLLGTNPVVRVVLYTAKQLSSFLLNDFKRLYSGASMVASAGETDRDLAWAQLTRKLRTYNIIEFKHYKFKLYIIFYNVL